MPSEIVPIILVFSIPIIAIITHHRRKMMELQLQQRQPASDMMLHNEINALRSELNSLKDTTTQYDLSFDTALQRMEQRVEGVERQVRAVQSEQSLHSRIQ